MPTQGVLKRIALVPRGLACGDKASGSETIANIIAMNTPNHTTRMKPRGMKDLDYGL